LTSLMETWFPPATTEKIGTVVNVMLKHSISRFYYEQPKQYQAKVEKILDIRTASLNRNCWIWTVWWILWCFDSYIRALHARSRRQTMTDDDYYHSSQH
jgi:hypothetical protein